MTDDKQQPNKAQKPKANLHLGITRAEWVISTTIGIVSGVVTAAATIVGDFAEEVKSWPGIADRKIKVYLTNRTEIDSAMARAESGAFRETIHDVKNLGERAKRLSTNFIEVSEKGLFTKLQEDLTQCNEAFRTGKLPGGWEGHQKAIRKIKADYAIARDAFLQSEYHIVSRGPKFFSLQTLKGITFGTWQRSGFIGSNTQGQIGFRTVVGAIIGAAATLSFFNGVASRHKIEKIEEAADRYTADTTTAKEPAARSIAVISSASLNPQTLVTDVRAPQKLVETPDIALGA